MSSDTGPRSHHIKVQRMAAVAGGFDLAKIERDSITFQISKGRSERDNHSGRALVGSSIWDFLRQIERCTCAIMRRIRGGVKCNIR